MATVTELQREDGDFSGPHPTEVVCWYSVGHDSGRTIMQLNTYGTAGRGNRSGPSQTMQFGEDSARELFEILRDQFGF